MTSSRRLEDVESVFNAEIGDFPVPLGGDCVDDNSEDGYENNVTVVPRVSKKGSLQTGDVEDVVAGDSAGGQIVPVAVGAKAVVEDRSAGIEGNDEVAEAASVDVASPVCENMQLSELSALNSCVPYDGQRRSREDLMRLNRVLGVNTGEIRMWEVSSVRFCPDLTELRENPASSWFGGGRQVEEVEGDGVSSIMTSSLAGVKAGVGGKRGKGVPVVPRRSSSRAVRTGKDQYCVFSNSFTSLKKLFKFTFYFKDYQIIMHFCIFEDWMNFNGNFLRKKIVIIVCLIRNLDKIISAY